MTWPVPLNDAVLIAPEPTPDYLEQRGMADSGLVLPEAYRLGPTDPPTWGKVLQKGAACKDAQVTVGSRVLYGKWAFASLIYEATTYALVRETDLLAVDG